ncbi:MAG: hemolysin [Microcystis aeruginosa BS13-02]|nr:hemolysin [Microcystis aeruginosa BS13-02]
MTVDQNSIVGLYVIYFNRAPDPAGLAFWQTQNVTIDDIAAQFGASPEAKAIYPFLAAPTLADPTAFINEIYRNAFGRNADTAGLTFWSNVLRQDSSPESVAQFVLAVAQGAQGTDKVALQNRADIALQFTQEAVNANIAFTPAVLATSSQIIDTVDSTAASVTAAQAAIDQAIIDIIGGGTGTTFTLLDIGAVLTAAANSKVAPEGKFLSTANDKVSALTFLQGSFIQDPSTSDNDVLTAQIVNVVAPTIENIETIQFSGATNASVALAGISKAKQVQVVKGDLTITDANNYAIDLVAGYASNLTLQETLAGKDLTVNLNGTTAGASITADLNDKSKVNLVVKAASVLSNADTTEETLKLDQTQSNFVITGDKNLTIDGRIDVIDGTNRLDATDFTGELTLTLGKNSDITQIVGGKTNDTFTLTAAVDQINGVNLNGNDGNDTLTVKVGNAFTTAINGVTNVETIIFKEDTAADTTITTVDALVASGATLTVDASSFTTKFLVFNGAAETNGSFKITGGALADFLTGGAKADTLTGNGGLDILTGGGGNDQFVLNKAVATSAVTINDFSTLTATNNNDVFALSNAAFAGAPAVGAALTVSAVAGATNSANTILLDTAANLLTTTAINYGNVRFAFATDTNQLYYDADGVGFTGASSILIANTPGFAGTLTNANFAIVA